MDSVSAALPKNLQRIFVATLFLMVVFLVWIIMDGQKRKGVIYNVHFQIIDIPWAVKFFYVGDRNPRRIHLQKIGVSNIFHSRVYHWHEDVAFSVWSLQLRRNTNKHWTEHYSTHSVQVMTQANTRMLTLPPPHLAFKFFKRFQL